MIISVTNLKGGVGKSTVAQNLAVCFAHMDYKTGIVDTDTNQTSMKWSSERSDDVPSVPVFGATESGALSKMVKALNKDYEVIVIDGKPSLSKITSKILLLADLVIVPTIPSAADFWALEPFAERFDQAKELNEKLEGYILCNRHNDHINLREEVVEALGAYKEEYGLETLSSKLGQRVVYEDAMSRGLGVYELKNKKAKSEVVALSKEVLGLIKKLQKK